MSTSVLRLVTRLNIGGPARQALLLSRELNVEFPTILAAGYAPSAEGELGDPAVYVRRVPLVRPIRVQSDVVALAAVRRLLQASGARLLHTHMAKAGTLGRIAACSVPRKVRTVHTFHGHVLDGYFPARVERALVGMERHLAQRTDVLIAVSPEVRDSLLDLGIGTVRQFQVMSVGLDLEAYLAVQGPAGELRTELGLGLEARLVGIIGRLVPIKDHGTLLRAMVRLPGVHLAVVGDGELRSSLHAEATRLNLEGRVHFLGWRHDLPAVLSDLDVVALSSLNEGTPVALIEALAAARPVVATDVGGVRHVVREGKTGFLVQRGDDEGLAAHLDRVLSDGELGRRMASAGRSDVRSRFGQAGLVNDTAELYRSLLPSCPRPAP